MSERYPGGLISRSAPVVVGPTGGEGGSASGVWTLEQAAGYIKQGLWPLPVLPRQLWSWGNNSPGNLGQGDTVKRSSPTQVGAQVDWSQLSTSEEISFAIKTTGTLWSWGKNNRGQLGQDNTTYRSSPVQVGALTDWAQVSSGGSFCAAIKTNGTLWSWGENYRGPLGLNISYSINRSSPVQVGALTDWAQVSAGRAFCAAVKTNGTLWAWGFNSNGQLGQNDRVNRSSPVQVGALNDWARVSAGNDFCVAIKTNGTLWSWGYDQSGALGLNIFPGSARSSPVQVGALTDWSQVSGGGAFCAAIKTNGALWSWGSNSSGQLGQNNVNDLSSPVQVGALTDWAQVAVGNAFCRAIKTAGTLWSWGQNTSGQLGQNNTTNLSSPVQVGSLTTWTRISQGSTAYSNLAIRN